MGLVGRGLGRIARVPQVACGFAITTHCGPTPQDNRGAEPAAASADAVAWFGQRRLFALAEYGHQQGAWPADIVQHVSRLVEQLSDLLPAQKPALCHGDLWSGNVMAHAEDHRPYMFDPAVAYGPAEADLAMTLLFGGFHQQFYEAYEAVAVDLAPGWRDRMDIYQLFHVLNHWLLFGGSYADHAYSILRRYGCT